MKNKKLNYDYNTGVSSLPNFLFASSYPFYMVDNSNRFALTSSTGAVVNFTSAAHVLNVRYIGRIVR
jgi:hypothetical protein